MFEQNVYGGWILNREGTGMGAGVHVGPLNPWFAGIPETSLENLMYLASWRKGNQYNDTWLGADLFNVGDDYNTTRLAIQLVNRAVSLQNTTVGGFKLNEDPVEVFNNATKRRNLVMNTPLTNAGVFTHPKADASERAYSLLARSKRAGISIKKKRSSFCGEVFGLLNFNTMTTIKI